MKLFYSCLLVLLSLALISTEATQHHPFSRTTAAYFATASLYGFTAASFLATAYCTVVSSRLRYGIHHANTREHHPLYDLWAAFFLFLGIAGLGNVYYQYKKSHAHEYD